MARSPELDVLDTVLNGDVDEEEAATAPVDEEQVDDYKLAKGMSVLVPKSFGKLWQTRVHDAEKAYDAEHRIWSRVMELYRQCGKDGATFADGEEYNYYMNSDADENIIRTNIRSIMRGTYMQNPFIEFTDRAANEEMADTLEYIIQFMMGKQTYPGINMKPKARRWILHGQITNFGVLRLDYQAMEGSRQQAVKHLQLLEKKLEKAKDKNEINKIYADIEVLHETLPLAQGKGMHLSNVLPHCFIVDPKATMCDLSDADWTAEWFDMDRTYMRQKYYYKDEDGTYRMRSNPDTDAVVDDVSDYTPGKDIQDQITDTVLNHRSEEQKSLASANTVRCYYIYDKILRRVYLFNNEDWSYPLWAEDDDMQLSRFFRHFVLAFGEPIDGIVQPGEVSYYVGQVNEVNRVNRKAKAVRDSILNTIVYNSKNVDKKEVEKLINHLRNPGQVQAFGVATDQEKSINQVLEALAPPSIQYKEVFDTTNLRAAIDRSAATSEVDRGGEFKTNTTNDAVQYHAQNRQQTTTVIIDAIEDSFEALGWSMAELLVSKYSKEEIAELVGQSYAEKFIPMNVQEFNQKYRLTIAAGSIEKPTSEFKKQESLNVAQALGQVGQAAPVTTMTLIMRMMKEAFSNFVVKKEDWEMLAREGQANLTKGQSVTDGQGTGRPAQVNS